MKKAKTKNPTSVLSSLPTELTTVTTLSKAVATIVFIALPFIGFLIGVRYEQFASGVRYSELVNPLPLPQSSSPVACTMDAQMCPDGTAVGRIPPNCQFAACPSK
jgi:hypothetical protein